jgi:hypothetical protein
MHFLSGPPMHFLSGVDTTLDPGGKLANRPSRSLRQIYLLWRPQTNVGLDDRLKVLKGLRKTQPGAAWALFLELYPKSHDTSHNNPLPRWRDFSADNPEVVTRRGILRGAEQLGTWLLEDVGTDAGRWVALIERYADLSPAHRKDFLARCEALANILEDALERARIQDAIRQLVNRHRKYGQPSWVLPEEDLQALEKAYDALTPKGLIEKSAWLFASEDADLIAPEGHDWKENIAASRRARADALAELMVVSGIAGVKELAGAARMPALAGEAFADVADREVVERELKNFARSHIASEQELARGIIWACNVSQGEAWADELIDRALQEKWEAEALARVLLALPAREHFLRRASAIGGETARKYWRRVPVFLLPDDSGATAWVAKELLKHGRPHAAIKLAGHEAKTFPDELLVRILEAAAQSEEQEPDGASMFRYYVQRIFQQLDKSEKVGTDRLARLEWMYLKVLDDSARPPVTLHKQLATKPEFFVEVLSTIYRGNNEEPGRIEEEDRERKAALASHAWTLLHSWHLLPGTTSKDAIDEAVLGDWVAAARRLCREADRIEIGDQQIGQVLAWAPSDADGTWPCEPVRDAIEVTRSRDLETGLYIGVKNKRGVTSRGPLDGGDQERDLAKRYREHSEAVRFEWPRTSAVLDRIAESYKAEAKEHDDDAERRQW